MTQKLVESQAWRSLFRHGYPDTPLNQSLVMMGNVFLHLHPVKVSRQAMKITYTWCLGGISFFLFTLFLSFTGYLLPWDQIAIWAITVGTNLAPYAPILGDPVYKVLVAGSSVAQPTLIRFYVAHVILLPLAGALLMAVHFWRIRKDGGAAGPPPPARRDVDVSNESAPALAGKPQ